MTHKPPVSSELSRELSLFHITMMGLGMMIGAGVFIGIGNSIYHAGPGGVMLTFALNGVIAMFTAMSYAELSSAIPRAGGAYNFGRIAFGRGTSFLAGWLQWFASSVAGSLYAVTFAIYTVRYFLTLFGLDLGPAATSITEKVLALIVVVLFVYTNYRGASETGKIGAFFTFGQTLFLVLIGVAGVLTAMKHPSRLSNFQPFLPRGWSALLLTMGFTYVAFEGYEVIAQAGDEAIDPRRNLPKAMLYSVLIVTLTYVAVAFATVVAVQPGPHLANTCGPHFTPQEGAAVAPWVWIGSHGARGFGEAVSGLMPAANLLLTLAVIFASTSALNATIYSAARASYALGRDNMLPTFFARISKRRKTPYVALLFTAGIVILVATCLPTMDVASSASIMFLFLFFLVNVCVIKIRRNMMDELTYGYLMPFFPLFPIVALIFQVLLAAWLIRMSLIAWVVAPVWIGAGVVIYHLYSKHHVVTTADEIQVLEEERAPEGEGCRIMVAVANPDNAIPITRTTYTICDAKDARVELIHMVPVPETVPLSDAKKYVWEGKEAVVEAMIYLKPHFPLSTTVRYCRSIGRGIVSAVREKHVDMLVMGWQGHTRTQGFSLGSTVDPIIERSPCDVVLMKNCGGRKFKNILVPLAGGPNGGMALEIAGILADKEEGKIVALNVDDGRHSFDLNAFVNERLERVAIPRERVRTTVVKASSAIDAILKESEDYDLIVLGCTRQSWVSQFATASVPETVAGRTDKPVVMTRAAGGLRSWIRRWI